jgi:serine phosphatase RsbU (regulator of sigma subunit)
MLVQLAQMASVAAENARLYARERTIAQTLQRSLLPPRLPDIPGVELGARYSAAGAGIEVGGDFYDVFPAEAGEWALTIGDICGKGPEASAVTALARYTIRAAAIYSNRPSGVLRLLSDAMLEQRPDGRFASVAYVRVFGISPEGAELEVALGGHPPPLILRADGTVDSIGAPGTLLGIVPEPRLADARARLEPGDVLVLYTDGVTDVRRGKEEVFGLSDLRALLQESIGLGPSALAARIEEEVLRAAGARPRDDVAVLTLAVPAT